MPYLRLKHLPTQLALFAMMSLPAQLCCALEARFELNTRMLDEKHGAPRSPAQKHEAGSAAEEGRHPKRTQRKVGAHKRTAGDSGKRRKTSAGAAFTELQVRPATLAQKTPVETVQDVIRIWPQIVEPRGAGKSHFGYRSNAFALSLDPQRYPLLPAQDGGSILVDRLGALPDAVKSLIEEKDPQVRIVSEDPGNRRGFYRSLLNAAHFYSAEEDFSVEFGTDSKITVQADFKIEKDANSLLQQDLILLNVVQNRRPTPRNLVRLLAQNGFRLVETAVPYREKRPAPTNLLCQVTDKEPKKITDALLDALSVRYQTGKSIDVYAQDDIGVRLDVPVDRYFEEKGERFIVTVFSGDPVSYTLLRLLETKRYRVVVLQENDNLQTIADKLLPLMQVPASHGESDLWPVEEPGYGVRMSGVMIRDGRSGYDKIFVTDKNVAPLVKELAGENGYFLGRR